MNKAIVFGSNGYIGKHLVSKLLKEGFDIRGYDIDTYSVVKESNNYQYNKIDVLDIESLSSIDFQVDYVYYFSGLTGTRVSIENYSKFIDVNEKGLLNVLNKFKEINNKPLFVLPSTRLVYKGKKDTPLHEESEKEFKTVYALNKYHNEQVLKMYKNLYDIHYLIFRICVPYGNDFNEEYSYGTIGFFIKNAVEKANITLYGEGSLKRTFTHVNDICNQMTTIAKTGIKSEVFNIGGECYSLRKIAKLIADKYNATVKFIEFPPLDLQLESGDTIFDSKKIEKFYDLKKNILLTEWLHEL